MIFDGLADAGDKAVVDLDHVEGVVPQGGQGRIAGAEVVHREANTQRLDALEQLQGVLGFAQQFALGHLQFQAVAGKAVVRQCLGDLFQQPIIMQLKR